MSPVRVGPSLPFDLGQAEVGDPDLAVGVEQEVRRLDVAVQDTLPWAWARASATCTPIRATRSVVAGLARSESAELSAGPERRPADRRPASGRRGGGPVVTRPQELRRPRSGRVRSRWRGRAAAPAPRLRAVGGGPPGRSRRRSLMTASRSAAVDELHRVIVRARRARRRRGPARCSCDAAAPPSGPRRRNRSICDRVDPPVQRQDLQRHVPAERLLDRLVDDAHAAPADLAEDPEIAQAIERRRARHVLLAHELRRSGRAPAGLSCSS